MINASKARAIPESFLQSNMKRPTMRRLIYAILLLLGSAVSANATVLFPYFVDIAPNYEDGLTEELKAAGVPCGLYHSTKPGFLNSNFTEVEDLFKETLPSDVERFEQKRGNSMLVVYTSVNKKDDALNTKTIKSYIYILRRADNSFVAAYCEQEEEL